MQVSRTPSVSFLVPVKDASRHIEEAVGSILSQTMTNIEVVIIDDGCSDNSIEICRRFKDPRINIFSNPGKGLVDALNYGIEKCRALFIARMDADDICIQTRAEDQYNFLRKHPEVGCVCSDIIAIDDNGGRIGEESQKVCSNNDILALLLYERAGKPIVHPSCMFRRKVLEKHRYREITLAEDRDLWLRISESTQIRRINTPLLKYRRSINGVSRMKRVQHETASFMATLNFQCKIITGVDLFEERHAIYDDLNRHFERKFHMHETGVNAFNEFKNYVHSRRYIRAIYTALINLMCGNLEFVPTVRRKQTRNNLANGVQLSEELLAIVDELPTKMREAILN